MEEIWKDIDGYEGLYQVSNIGRVRSLGSFFKKVIVLKFQQYKDGYQKTTLYKNGKPKTYKTHRLVAKAFLPNTYGLPQINHIDGNKSNNVVTNLEWCSASQNTRHAIRIGLITFKSKSKPVIQVKDGVEIARYESINDAERKTGINNIGGVANGRLRSAGGFCWKFAD